MNANRITPARSLLFAALALGSLAVFLAARGPVPPSCAAERAARAEAAPGFVALAGAGDPRCLAAAPPR